MKSILAWLYRFCLTIGPLPLLIVLMAGCVLPPIVPPVTTTTTLPPTTTTTLPPVVVPGDLSHRASFLFDNAAVCTLDVFGPGVTDEKRLAIFKRCVANGDDALYLMMACSSPVMSKSRGLSVARGTPYSFFSDRFGGTVDMAKVKRMQGIIEQAQAMGLKKILVWCFSDGDAYVKASWADKQVFLKALVTHFDRYIFAYVTGCEVDEGNALGKSGSKQVATYLHTITSKPVGPHQLPGHWDYAKDGVYQFAAVQYGWDRTPAQVESMTRQAQRDTGKFVIAMEYSKSSDTPKARAMGQGAFRATPATGNGR